MKVTITATAPTVLYGETWLTAGWITELRIFAGARIYWYEIFMTIEIYIMDFLLVYPLILTSLIRTYTTTSCTGHTQKNGAVSKVNTNDTAPFFCVCPV